MSDLFIRDPAGILHVVALSGGHDSTALAFLLKEQNPKTPYNYVCTPTGNELPEMFEHWRDGLEPGPRGWPWAICRDCGGSGRRRR